MYNTLQPVIFACPYTLYCIYYITIFKSFGILAVAEAAKPINTNKLIKL